MKKSVQRMFSWIAVLMLTFTMLTGCGQEKEMAENGATKTEMTDDAAVEIAETAETGAEELSSSTGTDADTGTDTDTGTDAAEGMMDTLDAAEASADFEAKMSGSEEIAGDEELQENQIEPGAGVLTAGEWNDNENWGYYKNLFAEKSAYKGYKRSFGMDFTNRLELQVTDGKNPVSQAKAELFDTEGKLLWTAYTNPDGKAYLFYRVRESETAVPGKIVVKKGEKEKNVDITATVGQTDSDDANGEISQIHIRPSYEVELADSAISKQLDLMFMIDTTGSMGDEITYLQEELKNVVSRVKNDNGNLPIRISMNFYKDEGADERYVVSANEFTERVDEAQALLNAEYADGGGDFPEAVAEALENAVREHDWNADSIKVLILVLDAPAHEGTEEQLYDAICEASRLGIRIIPVASSGIDKNTEFFLRAMGLATGGTYTFLTDHSGVGESHIEPTIGDYEVEKLNDLLVRVISGYLK